MHCHFRIRRRKSRGVVEQRAKLLAGVAKINARGARGCGYTAAPETAMAANLSDYIALMRLDRPVGSLLLLWPTLAALWLAADGWPPWPLIAVFTVGTFV